MRAELEKRYAAGMKNFHIDWGEKAPLLSREERAEQILKCFEEIDRWGALSDEEKMRVQIGDAYAEVYKALRLCRFNVSDIAALRTPERQKLSEIFGLLDGALMLLGNWVSHEQKTAVPATLVPQPGFVELGERPNTDPQQTTASVTSPSAGKGDQG